MKTLVEFLLCYYTIKMIINYDLQNLRGRNRVIIMQDGIAVILNLKGIGICKSGKAGTKDFAFYPHVHR